MRDRVAVVGVVLLEGRLQVTVDVLALDEQQRQPVDETDDVRPAPVEIAAHPRLAHAEEVVVRRFVEVEDAQAPLRRLALLVAIGDMDTVAQQVVLLAVRGHDRPRRNRRGDASYGVVVGFRCQAPGSTPPASPVAGWSAPLPAPMSGPEDRPLRSRSGCARPPIPSQAAAPGSWRSSAVPRFPRCRTQRLAILPLLPFLTSRSPLPASTLCRHIPRQTSILLLFRPGTKPPRLPPSRYPGGSASF